MSSQRLISSTNDAWLVTAASAATPALEDCARLTLVYSSGQTSRFSNQQKLPRQSFFCSRTVNLEKNLPSNLGEPIQTVTKDVVFEQWNHSAVRTVLNCAG